jgi:RNA polymerase sigma factor, sigma-70 family
MQNIEEIYKQYFTTVNKYLFCLTRNQDLSKELTQETFYRAVKKIDSFKGDCKISVWLCQIAKNLWYDELNKQKRTKPIEEDELKKIEARDDTENNIANKEEKMELYRRIQKLDKQTKEVVYLRLTGELSFKEIGDILNKSENWARVTFYRGKQKLKEVD